MWKSILLFCLFITFCFLLPSFFIDFSMVNNNVINVQEKYEKSGDVNVVESGEKIKLLLSESNKVIELSMDDYIKGVVLRRNAYNF